MQVPHSNHETSPALMQDLRIPSHRIKPTIKRLVRNVLTPLFQEHFRIKKLKYTKLAVGKKKNTGSPARKSDSFQPRDRKQYDIALAILIQIFRPPPCFHPSVHPLRATPADAYNASTAFTKHRLPGTPVNRPGNTRSLSKLFVTSLSGPISSKANAKIFLWLAAPD